MSSTPAPQGLYDGRHEHDACGVAFVADMSGRPSHEIVRQGVLALDNLEHRGASGSEANTGDGAGILLQVPDAFLRAVCGVELPPAGAYAVGMAFLPDDDVLAAAAVTAVETLATAEGLSVLGWRDVPVHADIVGASARAVMPRFRLVFVASAGAQIAGMALERMAFCLRKRAEREAGVYFPSLSARTLVYKGMLTAPQLDQFFPDLADDRMTSALALVHSRFSTNTFPSWPLAHPYRYIAHNGEINTVKGNRNWMAAREALLSSDLIPGDLTRLFPIVTPGASDSASFDEVLELLHLGGRALPHAVLMMIPEAWENHAEMDPARRAFYEYHSSLMEPWDGPACVTFTDGTLIGAVLDRNGLRPGRFWVTEDGIVVLASEAGVLPIDQTKIVRKGRLQPGRMLLVDLERHRIVEDDEVKADLASANPYAEWLEGNLVSIDDLPARDRQVPSHDSVLKLQQTFGYTEEELRLLVSPMALAGAEALGSMGTDTPIAVLSNRPRTLFDYFQQLFAQVTNPPLDAIREELVTSLRGTIGPEGNLLTSAPAGVRQICLPFPVLSDEDLAKLVHVNDDGTFPEFSAAVIRGLFPVAAGAEGLRAALDDVRRQVSEAIAAGTRLVVLSDRGSDATLAPIPALLLTSAVHHHMIREKTRTQVGLVVETGEAREVHHVALLIGYGAAAVNPYAVLESVEDLVLSGRLPGIDAHKAVKNYIKAAGKGVLKVMSKMGISTVASYTGAQVFEAVGLSHDLIDEFFPGTTSQLSGIGLDVIAREVAERHQLAWPENAAERAYRPLEIGGEYQWRREGEYHLFNPATVFTLQHATRSRKFEIFKEYTAAVDDQAERLATLRGLFEFKDRTPIPIDEVEPITEIMKRFNTGAMSYGSISAEAHETLAIAMNRIGGRSNTGEGGEDPERFVPMANGDSKRSAVKQVASGRFGVTSEYLTNADDLQIKMAQGAKPGEGGQLPGHKVYPWIAKTRHSTAGVGLISPPPHHDIYSIEDLK
ncbi:MAG: gltB, partial [Frankiales bacterium]|nr:gltB [Frankiales bacterium]